MCNLKINQARTISSGIVNDIIQMGIAVRPPIIELGTPESMGPAKLSPRSIKRTRSQGAAFQVLAEMHSRNRIHTDGSRTLGECAKSGFLEQTKAIYFPLLPFLGIDPNVNTALS